MTQPITPVVPCGGMGSRLWPLSRQDQPKQFRPTQGKGSLTYFQATVQRHRNDSFGEPIVVTNARQAALVHRQRDEVQLQGRIIGEPVGRNTGPAGLAAAICAHREDPDAVLLILPSDHVIKGDINRIITALRPAAEDGRIVTFGVTPTDPETGLRVCPETDHRGGGLPGVGHQPNAGRHPDRRVSAFRFGHACRRNPRPWSDAGRGKLPRRRQRADRTTGL